MTTKPGDDEEQPWRWPHDKWHNNDSGDECPPPPSLPPLTTMRNEHPPPWPQHHNHTIHHYHPSSMTTTVHGWWRPPAMNDEHPWMTMPHPWTTSTHGQQRHPTTDNNDPPWTTTRSTMTPHGWQCDTTATTGIFIGLCSFICTPVIAYNVKINHFETV